MTNVATIQSSAAADPAVLNGSARSADSSGRFATELDKTTQQVRERQDGHQHATARQSEERKSDNSTLNTEPMSSEKSSRIRTPKTEVDQNATQNLVPELTDSEGKEDLGFTSIGLSVTVPVGTESLDSELVDLGAVDPNAMDAQLETSSEFQEGMTSATLGSGSGSGLGAGSLSGTNGTMPDELLENNTIKPAVVTGNFAHNQVGSEETVTNGVATGSADSVADEAMSGAGPNVGTAPVTNIKSTNSLTNNGAQVDALAIDSPTETTSGSLTVDGEAGEVPSDSDTVPEAKATTPNESGLPSDGASDDGSPDNRRFGTPGESAAGVERAGQFEGEIFDRTQGNVTRSGLEMPVSPVMTNQVAASGLSQATLDPGSPIPSAEPKAPAPVAAQMSAHLSTFKGLANGTYETTLRLYPEELGQVSVRIQVNGGTVSIHAFGASDVAVQALREAMPDLRQNLLQSGLDLVDSQVDQGSSFLSEEQESASGRMVDSSNPDSPVNQQNSEIAGDNIDDLTNNERTEGSRVDVRV
jgi:flagellar hook-length control protein FliK